MRPIGESLVRGGDSLEAPGSDILLAMDTQTLSPIFDTFSDEQVRAIIGAGREIELAEKDIVFRAGEEGATMYLLMAGSIRLIFAPPREPKILSRGDLFGELALIRPGHTRTATAMAIEPTRLVELSRDVFEVLVDEHPRLLLRLLQVVSGYLLGSEHELIEELTVRNRELRQTLDYLHRTKQELDLQELLARTDELTRLYNRRCFNDQIIHFMDRAKVEKIGLALLLIDLDGFKSINDVFGHASGDAALVHVAEIVRSDVRRYDLPCRLGGDEFAVLFFDIGASDARTRGRQIRERIAASHFLSVPGGEPLQVAASIGGTMIEEGDDAEKILCRADRFLYQAKQAGKNRLCWGGVVDGT